MADEQANNLKLTSSAFSEGQSIPAKFTCKGDNVNPPLTISDVPTEAKSLALIMHDPDAPAGDWVHWTAWNIAPNTTEIIENSTPTDAVQGKTSFDKAGYGGPCPPSGTHRYLFELYALDDRINLDNSADRNALVEAMAAHTIAKTSLTGLFSAN